MIKYVKRKNLDTRKYDACIENSMQSRIYAFSWYLDIVADNWDVLVLDDYVAVMPLPWGQKYFIKYISQPFFCQQLGVFSFKKTEKDLFLKFQAAIPKKYIKITLQFNSENYFEASNFNKKNNYILSLNTPYEILFKSFNKGRKHAVKKSFRNSLEIKHISIESLLVIQKEYYSYRGFSKDKLIELSDYAVRFKRGQILGVFKKGKLLGGGVFLKSSKRIIYLFSSFNKDGRKHQAASFLIDYTIKKNENCNLILDFEGGNIPSIGSFFKSFGAKTEHFYQYVKTPFN